jgi:hypothetical protein
LDGLVHIGNGAKRDLRAVDNKPRGVRLSLALSCYMSEG